MQVLITGANGFIGRNLQVALRRRSDIHCVLMDVENDPKDLKSMVAETDIVYHLAGVNRPRHPDGFKAGNLDLTQTLVDAILSTQKRIPVIFSSSIQAERDNPYGTSKRQAEEVLRSYHEKTGAPVRIFRFPNVFGKWSRPNYNSVVSTFCHHILNGLPVEISNRDNMLTLVHIDEVVRCLTACLSSGVAGFGYGSVTETFTVTLGELHDRITDYRAMRDRGEIPDMRDAFNRRLYGTFLAYLEPNQCAPAVDLKTDNRGWLFELVKSAGGGQVFVSKTKPGIMRGNHYHNRKVEKFCVIQGSGRIRLRRLLDNAIETIDVNDDPIKIVDIPPGYTHSIENTGDGEMLTLFWTNEIFNPNSPDTWPENVVHLPRKIPEGTEKTSLLFENETYKIRGCVYEVYRELGVGFLEPVYQECLEIELLKQEIPFVAQKPLSLAYKSEQLKQSYAPDLICYDTIIVELKAVKSILPEHKAQLMNYLKATDKKVGLLVNFGSFPKATIERFVL